MDGSIYSPKRRVDITLEFDSGEEAGDLYEELKTWTPHGGWSNNASKLFELLKQARDD